MTKKRLVIIGAGGHGRVCSDVASKMDLWQEIVFVDDNPGIDSVNGFPVIGATAELEELVSGADTFVAIGNNLVRRSLQSRLEELGKDCVKLVHPSAVIARNVHVDQGTVVMAGVIVNPGTRIGKGCIINTGATVDHDCTIGEFVHISPGVHVAGNVAIGPNVWLGIGCIVINGLNISDNSIIGAGSVVLRDVTEQGTYVGVPARKLK
ncbi:MAG: acetyltransferase [Peptococcaceae bacterium]|nr:acetyltransferase [Peptococcaceae bacterium]